jgi:hypothetical protein
MSHSSGGVIHLDSSDADVEEVGSDVEEVVRWDHELCKTKMFSTGFLILSGRRFDSTNLEEQQKRVPARSRVLPWQVTASKGIRGAQSCLQALVEVRDIAQEKMECALCCGAFGSSAGASTSG